MVQPDDSQPTKRSSGRSIRSHEKSRHGCLTCKKRRIKCDENRPQCLRCQTDKRHCEYKITQLHFLTQQSGDPSQEHVKLPVPATLLPVHLTVTKEALDFRFFLQYSVPLLCSMSAYTHGSSGPTSLFADCGVSSLLGLRTHVYDKLWKELMPSIIYSNPPVHKLVCFFASMHRAAVDNTFEHDHVAELEGYGRILATVRRALQDVSPETLIAISITLFAIDNLRTAIKSQPHDGIIHLQASMAMIDKCVESRVVKDFFNPVRKHFQSLFTALLGSVSPKNQGPPYSQSMPVRLELPPAFDSCQEAAEHFTALVCRKGVSGSAEPSSSSSTAISHADMLSALSRWRDLMQSFYKDTKQTKLEDVNDVLTLLYEVNLLLAASQFCSKSSMKSSCQAHEHGNL